MKFSTIVTVVFVGKAIAADATTKASSSTSASVSSQAAKTCGDYKTCFGCYSAAVLEKKCKFCTKAQTTTPSPVPSSSASATTKSPSTVTTVSTASSATTPSSSQNGGEKPLKFRALLEGKCVDETVDCEGDFPEQVSGEAEVCKAVTCQECLTEAGMVWKLVAGKEAGCVLASECTSGGEGESQTECLTTCPKETTSKDAAAMLNVGATMLTSLAAVSAVSLLF